MRQSGRKCQDVRMRSCNNFLTQNKTGTSVNFSSSQTVLMEHLSPTMKDHGLHNTEQVAISV